MTTTLRLPGTVTEIDDSPHGPGIGAFFDLDGTLIAGYSARYLAEHRFRDREVDATELLRMVGLLAQGEALTPETFGELLALGAQAWRGRAAEDIDELGLRLFDKKIVGRIYPEMREIVRAHQRRGHTVVLTSSATSMQVEPVAAYLGIEHVVCNRYVVEDDVLTGEIARPVIWGPAKAEAAQRFAETAGIDLSSSYFYADGDEDEPFMHLVGNPRPTNPGDRLARTAKNRGWPVLRFDSRGSGSMLRTVAALGSLLPISSIGLGLGLARRNPRTAVNFVAEHWIETMFRINGVQIDVLDEENAWAQRPAVFIFNHRNGFDPFIAAKIIRRDFTGIAKAELRKDPIVGTIGRLADVAFVDRADSASAVASLEPIQEMAAKGLSVLVAPEGTRLDTSEVGPFKKGAFRIAMAAGIPIVPIVIRNAEIIGSRDAMSMNPGRVQVRVLEPIPVDDWTLGDLPARIEDVRQRFLDALSSWPDASP